MTLPPEAERSAARRSARVGRRRAAAMGQKISPLARLPMFINFVALSAVAMLIPAAHAVSLGDWAVARVFGQCAALTLLVVLMIGLAVSWRPVSQSLRTQLLTLVATYLALPLLLATPFFLVAPAQGYYGAYFEMVSSLTTTGATLYQDPAILPPSLHLWRALLGWFGGFFIWVMAAAVFQPLNLGGYEVMGGLRESDIGHRTLPVAGLKPAARVETFMRELFPVYAGLTGALWLGLVLAGDDGLTGLCHAMGTLSTSGISPVTGGLAGSASGRAGEVLILLFLVFALSRRTFASAERGGGLAENFRDPEFRLGLLIIFGVSSLLILRHWLGAIGEEGQSDAFEALRNLWGAVFSAASFLTTTGYISVDWLSAPGWSGLATPGVILMGLAVFGGGVATAAGGVKLLRVYALWRHGLRELDKLLEPRAVIGGGVLQRHLRGRGGEVAWVFFMLFALSAGAVMLALSLTGLVLEEALIFAIAALSTTGNLALVAGEAPLTYAELGTAEQLILVFAMVLGRIETLAVIALLNPAFWRS